LAPYTGGGAGAPRLEVAGPEVRLSSGAAVALGMAFHELATNAAKHGALSVASGRVRLSWGPAEADADGARWHGVLWEEAGGPPLPGRPPKRGFGTRLLERGLAAQIGGAISLDFALSGLHCRIRVPAEDGHGAAPHTEPTMVRGTDSGPAGAEAT
jgi:two-component sensor histidine kinase